MGVLRIPFYKPTVSFDDFVSAIKSRISRVNFEAEFASFLNSNPSKVLFLDSGTSAFYLFLKLFTKKGDEIILPSLLCPIMLNPVINLQRKTVIVDIDPETFNISIEDLEKKISEKTRVIVPVHTYGQVCEIEDVMKIAEEKEILVLEDCAHALGAKFKGKMAGTFGYASFFSLNWTKVITSGGGGILVLNHLNVDDVNRISLGKISKIIKISKLLTASILIGRWNLVYACYRNLQKIIPRKIFVTPQNSDLMTYSRNIANKNITPKALDDFSLKLTAVSFKKLKWLNEKRREIARIYYDVLEGAENIKLPVVQKNREHIFYVFTVRVKKRDKIKDELLKRGIETAVVWPIPLHEIVGGDCPNCSVIVREILSLPIYPHLSEEDAICVAENLIKVARCI